jgi:uncharacterized protein YbaP (TraB family)
MRLFLVILLAVFPQLAPATTCAGQSLLPAMSDADRARLAEAEAAQPYGTGNIWRATRDDREIWIVGTMHIDDPRHDATMDLLRPVFDRTDLILLEATPEEEAALKAAISTRPELLFLTSGPTLPDLLSEDDWMRVAAAASDRGIPGFMAAKFQPWYLSIVLSMPPCMMAQMSEGANGLDRRITDLAQSEGIAMRALEPYYTLFRIFSDEPVEEQVDWITLTMQPTDAAEDMFATMSELYFSERHSAIWEMSRIEAERQGDLTPAEIDAQLAKMEEAVALARNRAWIPVILNALAETSGPIVVAAGAAHLGGSEGVLNLLAAQGFALERQAF